MSGHTTARENLPDIRRRGLLPPGMVRALAHNVQRIQAGQGINITRGVNGALYIELTDPFSRFYVEKHGEEDADATKMRVYYGEWWRKGAALALEVDSGKDYATVTGFSDASTTYYLYLEIDNLETPTKITAEMSEDAPTDTEQTRVIAKVVTDSDSEISEITRYWQGGDIYAQVEPLQIFDLYDVTATTLKVRGDTDDKLVCVAGEWIQITGGSHALDADITISGAVYIYITVTRTAGATPTATLESGAAKLDGNSTTEHILLWYIAWDAGEGAIDFDNCIQYRDSEIHLDDRNVVGVDEDAAPDFLGATGATGVLRVGHGLDYTDNGGYITLTVDESDLDPGNQGGLTEITVVTAVEYNTSTGVLRYEKRTAKVVDPGTPSYTTITTAADCP